MGGECNYLLRVQSSEMRLEFVPDAEWKSAVMLSWTQEDIEQLLTDAEHALVETAHRLRLPVQARIPLLLCLGSSLS
jgi:hypothetical protein